MKLTKTDFIQYLNCPEALWLSKHRPEQAPKKEFSLFLEKLIREGFEVEEFATKLFPKAIELPKHGSHVTTKEALSGSAIHFLQASFEKGGMFARIDILERKNDGSFHIYEVKSSTKVRTTRKHNHLKDVCFQKFVMQESGYKVSGTSIIHLNGDYKRSGDLIPAELLKIQDVTSQVNELYDEVVLEIRQAISLLEMDEISMNGCSCRYTTRSNHCDCFSVFNPDVPVQSVYEIGYLSEKKLNNLIDENIYRIEDVDSEFDLNARQRNQVNSVKRKMPVVDIGKIHEQINLEYPLHFIDYETYASAIPLIDGIGPHQHIPFQVSIHTLRSDGTLTHSEYLSEKLEIPVDLWDHMKSFTGLDGTFISWHASFEKTRNTEMAEMIPEFKEYLEFMNENMFDIEDVFKENYVDGKFRGYTSIKKVLPVMVPGFSYSDLVVQDGTMAMDLWGNLVLDPDRIADKEQTKEQLLEYCKLDTLAMVEIFKKLKAL